MGSVNRAARPPRRWHGAGPSRRRYLSPTPPPDFTDCPEPLRCTDGGADTQRVAPGSVLRAAMAPVDERHHPWCVNSYRPRRIVALGRPRPSFATVPGSRNACQARVDFPSRSCRQPPPAARAGSHQRPGSVTSRKSATRCSATLRRLSALFRRDLAISETLGACAANASFCGSTGRRHLRNGVECGAWG